MERPGVFSWWFPLFLFAVLSSAAAQNEPVYTKVNGTIRLKPDSSGPFTNILWKHKGDLVVEWVNNELDYYGMFKGRATLDTTTGGLVITNTDDSFTGPYTVELNSQVQSKGYEVEFIKEVNKPEVDVKPLACSHADKDCKLVCLHYDTAAFGPLTYSWREDNGDWKQGDREMPIVNDGTTQLIKTFSCRVKNPISLAESVPRDNPFYKEQNGGSSSGGIAAGVIVTILLGIAAGVGYVMYKKKHSFHPVQDGHDEEMSPANRNGDAGNQPTTQETLNEYPPAIDDTDKKTLTENVDDPGKNPSTENVANTAT